MHKPIPVSPPLSFLQKFEGKNQKINREGLLHLLYAKKNSLQSDKKQIKEELKDLVEFKDYPSKIIKSSSSQKHQLKPEIRVFKSQQLRDSKGVKSIGKRIFQRKRSQDESQNGENINQFKLPLISKSNSQGSLISKNVFVPKLQMIESDRPYRNKSKSGSFYSKHSDRASKQMEMDEYVLRHLQFLDKFQKQLISNRKSHPLKLSKS